MNSFTEEEKAKLRAAVTALTQGTFKFKYDYLPLINEFVSAIDRDKTKFISLKNDYYYIVGHTFIASSNIMSATKQLDIKYPESRKSAQVIDSIMKTFISGNPVEDYRFYKIYCPLSLDSLARRMSTEIEEIDDTAKELIRRGQVDVRIAILKEMNVYEKILELAKPGLNLLRAGQEIYRGNKSPRKNLKLNENIRVLKADPDFGAVFNCLDDQIRHANAHASRIIDLKDNILYLVDSRVRGEPIVGSYSFEEFADVMNQIKNTLFPIMLPRLILWYLVPLNRLLVSSEFNNSIQSL